MRLGLIITFCIETQEEHEERETMLSVSEVAQEMVEVDSNRKNVLVSTFIILEKSKTLLSVGEGVEQCMGIDLKQDMFYVSVFIIYRYITSYMLKNDSSL